MPAATRCLRSCRSSSWLPIAWPFHLGTVFACRRSPAICKVDYTGLSFVVPQKTRFRYRLVGHDAEWQDVGTQRQAFYSDLPPRDYVFQVTASNNDGVWNATGANVAFSIAPTFYQTRTFMVLCIARRSPHSGCSISSE